jgi:hypothetical protein
LKGDKGESGFSPPPGQKGERGPPGGCSVLRNFVSSVRAM